VQRHGGWGAPRSQGPHKCWRVRPLGLAAFLGFMALRAVAAAAADSCPQPGSEIATDRPDTTNSSLVVPQGSFQCKATITSMAARAISLTPAAAIASPTHSRSISTSPSASTITRRPIFSASAIPSDLIACSDRISAAADWGDQPRVLAHLAPEISPREQQTPEVLGALVKADRKMVADHKGGSGENDSAYMIGDSFGSRTAYRAAKRSVGGPRTAFLSTGTKAHSDFTVQTERKPSC
jgi:hypothetical protein